MTDHKVIKSKMKKTKPLLDDPLLKFHVPETKWFNEKNLEQMIKQYSTVYIKPDKGNQGKGIIRLRVLNRGQCEVSYGQTIRSLPIDKAFSVIEKSLNSNKKYIVQQGIELATYNKKPFDIRMLMQKPLDRWQFTMAAVKVAGDENAVVTNVSENQKYLPLEKVLFPLEKILIENDQRISPIPTMQQLIDLSHQISNVLSSHFPLRILGLDLALDKNGKIWFIEANTKPQNGPAKKVNDSETNQKYFEAKRMIKQTKK